MAMERIWRLGLWDSRFDTPFLLLLLGASVYVPGDGVAGLRDGIRSIILTTVYIHGALDAQRGLQFPPLRLIRIDILEYMNVSSSPNVSFPIPALSSFTPIFF